VTELDRRLPERMDWLRGTETGRAWLASLPSVAAECADQWNLVLGDVFPDAFVSAPIAATLGDGTEAVLKLQFPDRETEHEADALLQWDGDGAIRLLAHDPERHALLLERCTPGTPLSRLGADAALSILTRLLPRLWQAAGRPFRPLAEEAAWWAEGLERRAREANDLPRRLLDTALDALRTLPATQGEPVLLHQDLHAGNVLQAEREPWLVIDPKPLAGEREFGIAPIVRSFELGHGRRDVRYRLDRLTAELGLDRERARLWALAQTLAWTPEGEHARTHLETATWLLDDRAAA
jgi:streptomycin 6-kinase